MLKELLADMVDQIKDTAGSIIEYPPIEYQRGIGIDTQARKPHMCWFSAESLLEREPLPLPGCSISVLAGAAAWAAFCLFFLLTRARY